MFSQQIQSGAYSNQFLGDGDARLEIQIARQAQKWVLGNLNGAFIA